MYIYMYTAHVCVIEKERKEERKREGGREREVM